MKNRITPHAYDRLCTCPECCWQELQLRVQLQERAAWEQEQDRGRFARPSAAFNSRRGGLLVNVPPDCGDPSKPHDFDPTCICSACKLGLNRAFYDKWAGK